MAAHRELNHVKYLKGRDLLENLGNSLREQLLLVELLAYHQGACGRRGSTLRDSVEKRLSLTVKAKAYYTNTKHCECRGVALPMWVWCMYYMFCVCRVKGRVCFARDYWSLSPQHEGILLLLPSTWPPHSEDEGGVVWVWFNSGA